MAEVEFRPRDCCPSEESAPPPSGPHPLRSAPPTSPHPRAAARPPPPRALRSQAPSEVPPGGFSAPAASQPWGPVQSHACRRPPGLCEGRPFRSFFPPGPHARSPPGHLSPLPAGASSTPTRAPLQQGREITSFRRDNLSRP